MALLDLRFGLSQVQPKCQTARGSHLRLKEEGICFRAHLPGYWQKSQPGGYWNEGSRYLPAVGWGHTLFLALWPSLTWQLASSKPAKKGNFLTRQNSQFW